MTSADKGHLAALAAELGVDSALLARRGLVVAASSRADRVKILRFGALTLVAAPAALLPALDERIQAAQTAGHALTGAWLAAALGDAADYVLPWVASASLSLADYQREPDRAGPAALLLAGGAPELLTALTAASAARHATGIKTDWEQGGFGFDQRAVAAVVIDGQAVAAAGLRIPPTGVAQIGVLTHPAHRRRGHARKALALIAAEALRRGIVPEYRSLAGDGASRQLAAGVGFRERYHFLVAALRMVG